MDIIKRVSELKKKTQGFSPEEIIRFAYKEFGVRVNFSSSMGEEDQVITDMIAKHAPQIEVLTLDTGRLFPETYALIEKTQKKYKGLTFKIYFPDAAAVEEMVRTKGINLFYESVENRKQCCGLRKVEPLKRALANVDAWICGLRREQSASRAQGDVFEWDSANKKIKISPLMDWSLEDVRRYVKENNVDVNELHKKGFVSIGCAPCTRAIKPGEDFRAGRWWWEKSEQKECGLHNKE